MSLSKTDIEAIVTKFKLHDKDTGSPVVQIALLTERIKRLTEHLKSNKKDSSSRRGLLKLVGKRRRNIAFLKENDPEAYTAISKELGL